MFFADERRTERSFRGRDESICSRQGKLLVFVDFIQTGQFEPSSGAQINSFTT